MARIGKYAVHLSDGIGTLHSFLPGDEVPEWAAARMGEHCFADPDDEDEDTDIEYDAVAGPPPKVGPGSGQAKWRAYAEAHGVDVSNVEGRDAVIAALAEAGVPVE